MDKVAPFSGLYLSGDSTPESSTLAVEAGFINGDYTDNPHSYALANNSCGVDLGTPKKLCRLVLYSSASEQAAWYQNYDKIDVYRSNDNSTWEWVQSYVGTTDILITVDGDGCHFSLDFEADSARYWKAHTPSGLGFASNGTSAILSEVEAYQNIFIPTSGNRVGFLEILPKSVDGDLLNFPVAVNVTKLLSNFNTGFYLRDSFAGTSLDFAKWQTFLAPNAEVLVDGELQLRNLVGGDHSGAKLFSKASFPTTGKITLFVDWKPHKDHYSSALIPSIVFRNPISSRDSLYGVQNNNCIKIFLGENGNTGDRTKLTINELASGNSHSGSIIGNGPIDIDETLWHSLKIDIDWDFRTVLVSLDDVAVCSATFTEDTLTAIGDSFVLELSTSDYNKQNTEAFRDLCLGGVDLTKKLAVVVDSSEDDTAFLLHSEGVDGAAGFEDSSRNAVPITAEGTVIYSADATKFYTTSIKFDGSGSLSIPCPDFSGDFAVECYFNASVIDSDDGLFSVDGDTSLLCAIFNSALYIRIAGEAAITYAISAATWYHIAFERVDGVVSVYLEGAMIGSVNTTANLTGTSFLWGSYNSTFNYVGYLCECRISGTYRWGNPFTPPVIPYVPVHQCPIEIEQWTAQNVKIHTKLPFISAQKLTQFSIHQDAGQVDNIEYVGNVGEAAAHAVWDSDFFACFGMGQDPTKGALGMLDSTQFERNATPSAEFFMSDMVQTDYGPCVVFDGVDKHADVPVSDLSELENAHTVSFFGVFLGATGGYEFALTIGDGTNGSPHFGGWHNSESLYVGAAYNDGEAADLTQDVGTPHLFTWIYHDGAAHVLRDGVLSSSEKAYTVKDLSAAILQLGGASGNRGHIQMGMLRISKGVRSFAWEKATFLSAAGLLVQETTLFQMSLARRAEIQFARTALEEINGTGGALVSFDVGAIAARIIPDLVAGSRKIAVGFQGMSELHVGVGYDFSTIQSAADVAQAGTVIVIHPGTYNESVRIRKQIHFRGATTADECRVFYTGKSRAFQIENISATIQDDPIIVIENIRFGGSYSWRGGILFGDPGIASLRVLINRCYIDCGRSVMYPLTGSNPAYAIELRNTTIDRGYSTILGHNAGRLFFNKVHLLDSLAYYHCSVSLSTDSTYIEGAVQEGFGYSFGDFVFFGGVPGWQALPIEIEDWDIELNRWSPTDRHADITSASDLEIENAVDEWRTVRASQKLSDFIWFGEFTVDVLGNGVSLGVASAAAGLDIALGGDAFGWGFSSSGQIVNNSRCFDGAAFGAGDTIGVLVDANNGVIWWYLNGVAFGDISNPFTGGCFFNLDPEIEYTFACSLKGGAKVTANFGTTAFTHALPAEAIPASCAGKGTLVFEAPLFARELPIAYTFYWDGTQVDNSPFVGESQDAQCLPLWSGYGAAYLMASVAGDVLLDSAGIADASVFGAPVCARSLNGAGVLFNGSSDWAVIPAGESWVFSGVFFIQFSCFVSASGALPLLGNSSGWEFTVTASGISFSSAGTLILEVPFIPEIGTLFTVGLSRDSDNQLVLGVDGVNVVSGSNSDTFGDAALPIYLGANTDQSLFFAGLFADLRQGAWFQNAQQMRQYALSQKGELQTVASPVQFAIGPALEKVKQLQIDSAVLSETLYDVPVFLDLWEVDSFFPTQGIVGGFAPNIIDFEKWKIISGWPGVVLSRDNEVVLRNLVTGDYSGAHVASKQTFAGTGRYVFSTNWKPSGNKYGSVLAPCIILAAPDSHRGGYYQEIDTNYLRLILGASTDTVDRTKIAFYWGDATTHNNRFLIEETAVSCTPTQYWPLSFIIDFDNREIEATVAGVTLAAPMPKEVMSLFRNGFHLELSSVDHLRDSDEFFHNPRFIRTDISMEQRFSIYDAAGDPCFIEIADWDIAASKASLWFRAPVLRHGVANIFRLVNGASSPGKNSKYIGAASSLPAKNVWGSAHKVVMHMNGVSFDSSHILDSSWQENHAQLKGGASLVDGALVLDGDGDWAEIDTPTGIPIADASFSIVVFAKPEEWAINPRCLVSWGDSSASGTSNKLEAGDNEAKGIFHDFWGDELGNHVANVIGHLRGFCITFDGAVRRLYVDGLLIASDSPTAAVVASNLAIGKSIIADGSFFYGAIAELLISGDCFSASYVAFLDQSFHGGALEGSTFSLLTHLISWNTGIGDTLWASIDGRAELICGYYSYGVNNKNPVSSVPQKGVMPAEGFIAGMVTIEQIPVRRRVSVFERESKKCIASMYSDPETGRYRFDGLSNKVRYFVFCDDYERVYNATVADWMLADNEG